MSKLRLTEIYDGMWFVSISSTVFKAVKTEKAAWLRAYKGLQKLADEAKARHEGMK